MPPVPLPSGSLRDQEAPDPIPPWCAHVPADCAPLFIFFFFFFSFFSSLQTCAACSDTVALTGACRVAEAPRPAPVATWQ